ncbi:hypothetical protein T03_7288 [Trichinella britovi]|uniref:Uncharacterized protein n=1 Tax=Trichinella britovi TaxID=45882 RepID=A0A0V1CUH9_TRIBR|nr:hypothetical protein T03_7288 [Trichinella britovi]
MGVILRNRRLSPPPSDPGARRGFAGHPRVCVVIRSSGSSGSSGGVCPEGAANIRPYVKKITVCCCDRYARIIRRGCYIFWCHEPGTHRQISQTGQSLRSRTPLTEEVEIPERLPCNPSDRCLRWTNCFIAQELSVALAEVSH